MGFVTRVVFPAALAAIALSSCSPELTVPEGALITCGTASECPGGYRCEAGFCVSPASADLKVSCTLTPPSGQSAIKNGDVLTVGGATEPGAALVAARLLDARDGALVRDVEGLAVQADGGLRGNLAADGLVDGASVVLEVVVRRGARQSSAADGRSPPVRVDLQPPSGASLAVVEGAVVSAPEVTLAVGAAGATEMRFDGDLEGAGTFLAFAPTSKVRLSAGDGPKALTVRLRDEAFNEAQAVVAVTLDTHTPLSLPVLSGVNGGPKVRDFATVAVGGGADPSSTILASTVVCLDASGAELASAAVAGVTLAGGAFGGTVNLGTPCPGSSPAGARVALRVVVRNAAGVGSDPAASTSAGLLLDNDPPAPGTATLAPIGSSLPGYAPGEAVTLLLRAQEEDGSPVQVRIDGDVQPGARVGGWVDLEPQGALREEAVALSAGEGLKTVTVSFRDEVGNQTEPAVVSVVLDTVPPEAPDPAKLRLVEQSPAPYDATKLDAGHNTFALQGLAGAVVGATRVEVEGVPPVTVAVDGAGGFPATPASAAGGTASVRALDAAGHSSAPTQVMVPRLTLAASHDPARAGVQVDGEQAQVTVSSDVPLAAPPIVSLARSDRALPLVGQVGNDYSFALVPDSATDLEGVVVVRAVGERGDGASAPGTLGTGAATVRLDFTRPTLQRALVALAARPPGLPDGISGAPGAVAGAFDAADALAVEARDAQGSPLQRVAATTDGAFPELALGDNARASVSLVALDGAGNESLAEPFENDVEGPVLSATAVLPVAQRGGGAVEVSFSAADVHDLSAAPTVTIGARAASLVSGTTGTSDGSPHPFAYRLVVDAVRDPEGTQPVRVEAVDAAGNRSVAVGTVRLDYTPPGSANTTPGGRPSWNGSPAVLGTAADGGSGVERVEVSLRRFDASGDRWWNGAAFAAAYEVWLPAAGAGSWSYDDLLVGYAPGASYLVRHRAFDHAGNVELPGPGTSFTFDATLPGAAGTLSAQAIGTGRIRLGWGAAAGAVSRYLVHYDRAAGAHPPYAGTGARQGPSPIEVPGPNPPVSLDIDDLAADEYVFSVTAVDAGARESPFSNQATAPSRWWTWRNPALTGNVPAAVSSPGPGVLVAVGTRGTAWRSITGGRTWTALSTGTVEDLAALCRVGSVLVAVGNRGAVTRSVDGGLTWAVSPTGTTDPLRSCWGEAGTVLAAGGKIGYGSGDSGVIVRSTDWGATFGVALSYGGGLSGSLRAVWASGARGVAVGGQGTASGSRSGYAYFSEDGGATWTRSASTQPNCLRSVWGAGTTFVTVTGNDSGDAEKILRSVDGGKTWTQVASDWGAGLASVVGDGAGTLLAVGRPRIWRSTDWGANWTVAQDYLTFGLTALWWEGSTAVAVGPRETIYRSSDSGASWTRSSVPAFPANSESQLKAVWGDGTSVAALGGSGLGLLNGFLYSSDGGENFLEPPAVGLEELKDFWVQGHDLVAVGHRGQILRSGDDGRTWTTVDAGTGLGYVQYLQGIWGHAGVLVAVGDSPSVSSLPATLLRSTDGGASWAKIPLQAKQGLKAVSGSGDTVIAVGSQLIASSRDAGKTWTEVQPPSGFTSVWGEGATFLAVGESPDVWRTTDSGTTWSQLPTGATANLRAVAGSGDGVVAVGDTGTIVGSSDRGATWHPIDAGLPGTYYWSVSADPAGFTAVGGSLPGGGAVVAHGMPGDTVWQASQWGTSQALRSAARRNGDVVVVGDQGMIQHSADGGASWREADHFSPTPVSDVLWKVRYDEVGRVWAVGSSGVVVELGPP